MPGWIGFSTANEIYNFLYRGTAITIGSNLYLRLLVSPSTRSGGGVETNYTDYARFTLVRSTGVFNATDNGFISNLVAIAFPVANSLGNGDLVAFDVVDTSSGSFSKIYNGGPISPAKSIVVGKAPTFGINKLQFTM
jgi:hypothetical protein